jgi:hypothetical protein
MFPSKHLSKNKGQQKKYDSMLSYLLRMLDNQLDRGSCCLLITVQCMVSTYGCALIAYFTCY